MVFPVWGLVGEMGEFLEFNWFSPPAWLPPDPGQHPLLPGVPAGPSASALAPPSLFPAAVCSRILKQVEGARVGYEGVRERAELREDTKLETKWLDVERTS